MANKQSKFPIMMAGVVLAGVVILALGLFFLQQQTLAKNKLTQEIAAKNAQVASIEKELSQSNARSSELASLERRLSILDSNLLDYTYIPTYLQQIQKAARATGNTLQSIQPLDPHPLNMENSPLGGGVTATPAQATPTDSAPKQEKAAPASPYQVQQITLQVKGTYSSIMRLLDALRQFPKMIYVRTVNLTPQVENGVYTVSASIETFAILTPDQYRVPQDDHTAAKGGRRD